MAVQVRDFLTVRDAARVAGVHANTVRAWVKEGRLTADLVDGKHGPTYLIPVADVAALRRDDGSHPRPQPSDLLARLARAEDARVAEARARGAAEARLEEMEDLRARLREASAEISRMRELLAERRT